MRALTASDVVGLRYVRVEAEMRLADVRDRIREHEATHAAVFEGSELVGIVPLRACDIVSPSRIFADLLPPEPAREVREHATLDEVGAALEDTGPDAVVVRSDDGHFMGVITQHDFATVLLAESKRTIREIARLQGQQERFRILGQMVSGVAHNLSNSLVPLQWGLSKLRRNVPPPSDLVHSLALASAAADDIAALLGRLRTLYRVQGGDGGDELIDVPGLLRAVRDLTAPKWHDQARSKGIIVDVLVQADDVPQVRGHASELREVLVNLLVNAVDALDRDGTVTLRARRSNDHIVVEVQDTGVGMNAVQRRSCLTPFFTTKGEGGTGLGLSVSAEIVERHRGKLVIESAKGQGTTVRMVLPLAGSLEPDASKKAGKPGTRVLYIAHDACRRPAIEQFLIEQRIAVDLADSGWKGLARLEHEDYDVVITDLAMPKMDGIAVTQAVKRRNPATAVVLLTEWNARVVDRVLGEGERPDAVMARHDVPGCLARFVAQVRTRQCVPAVGRSQKG